MTTTIRYRSYTFVGVDILSSQGAVDAGLNGRTLDVDTYSATVRCTDPAIATFNRDDPVRILRGGSQVALLYLTAVTQVGPDLYTLSMTSSLGRLLSMEHRGGVYDGVDAGDVIDAICGVVPHFIQANFRTMKLYGWLPYVSPSGENGAKTGSAKDNLLQVLFALNATLRADAQGVLRIENLSTQVSAVLDADAIYRDGARVVHEPTVTAVTVIEHQYAPQVSATPKKLFEGTITAGGQTIVFSEPIDAASLAASGFSIQDASANYAVLTAGTGTLTGTPYAHTTREITKPVTQAPIPNVVRVTDATLVGLTNSSAVVDRLVAYYACRERIEETAVTDFLDAGDVVSIYDPFLRARRPACIEKMSPITISQVSKGSLSALVGYTPWQTIPFDDVREIKTGSGMWTVPDGVTQVSVVLIGAGSDGAAGQDGERFQPGLSSYVRDTKINTATVKTNGSVNVSVTVSAQGGAAGQGGAGGAGGSGGAILIENLTVSPGDEIPYFASSDPSIPTTFHSLSSADGSASADGYYDPIDQTFYARKGADGENGGSGGSAKQDGASGARSQGGAGWQAGSGRFTATDSYSILRCSANADVSMSGTGGGGAGGSSGNNAGDPGGDAFQGMARSTHTATAGSAGSGYSGTASAAFQSGASGSGGNGADGSDGSNWGDGGAGGGGGGGAGAAGSTSISLTCTGRVESSVVVETTVSVTAIATAYYGTAGAAGKGGAAGRGKGGCIILYYRRPITT